MDTNIICEYVIKIFFIILSTIILCSFSKKDELDTNNEETTETSDETTEIDEYEKNFQNFPIIEKISKYFWDNPIKTISFISSIIGMFYLFWFLITIQYFPNLNYDNFLLLGLLYFFVALVITSIIFPLIFLMPGYIVYSKFNSNDKIEKIFLCLIICIFNISFIWPFKFSSEYFFALFFILVINMFFFLYLKTKEIVLKISLFIFLFIFLILISDFISNFTSKKFKIGNYIATLKIKNICPSLKKDNNSTCQIKTYVLWRIGNYYILKYNNNIYKIPKEDVLLEKIYIPPKKNRKNNE